MRPPGVGAFGAAVLGVALVGRTGGLAARPADRALVVALWRASRTLGARAAAVLTAAAPADIARVVSPWCAARTLAAAAPASMPYARDDGLVSFFQAEDGI